MIEVGEYVRIEFGNIGKLLKYDIEDGFDYEIETNWIIGGMPIRKEEVIKHSFNIIDLIEEGDYVNRRKVKKVFIDSFNKKKRLEMEGTEINWQGDMSSIYCEAEDIKSIVTKEQMKSVEYIVKEEQ